MKNVIKMFKKYCSDDYDITKDFTYTELETEIKREVRKKDTKIDLDLFYELIELASEVEYDRNEDEHLNKSWEKAINNYLKKFYPKEKHYYLFSNVNNYNKGKNKMLTLSQFLKKQFKGKKIPSDLNSMCSEQHYSQSKGKFLFKGDMDICHLLKQEINVYIKQQNVLENKRAEKIKKFNDWLGKCPVEYTENRYPDNEMKTINFELDRL